MGKDHATALLAALGNMLILTFGTAQMLLWSIRPVILAFAAVTALFIAHNIAANLSRRQFEHRFGVSTKQYILLGVMPAAAVCVILFITVNVLISFGINRFLLWSIDSIPFEWIFLLFASGYSILFLAAQLVIAAREKW